MIALVIMATAQLSASLLDAYPQVTLQTAAQHISRCGVGAVTVKSNDALDADVLVVKTATSVSNEQLSCVEKAASFYDVQLPPSIQSRYNAIREARSTALMVSEGRKWLKAHHLLGRLPNYRPGVTDDAVYARKVEKLCEANGALQSRYGPHALSRNWMMQRKPAVRVDDSKTTCLLRVSWASGFKMGFIGNELATPR